MDSQARGWPCESAFLTRSQVIWTMLVWDHALSSVVKEDSPPPSARSTMIPNSWPSHTHLSLTSACPSACIKASAYALSSIISFNPSLQCSPFTLHYLAGLSSSKSLSHPNAHTQTHTHTRYSLILLSICLFYKTSQNISPTRLEASWQQEQCLFHCSVYPQCPAQSLGYSRWHKNMLTYWLVSSTNTSWMLTLPWHCSRCRGYSRGQKWKTLYSWAIHFHGGTNNNPWQ